MKLMVTECIAVLVFLVLGVLKVGGGILETVNHILQGDINSTSDLIQLGDRITLHGGSMGAWRGRRPREKKDGEQREGKHRNQYSIQVLIYL